MRSGFVLPLLLFAALTVSADVMQSTGTLAPGSVVAIPYTVASGVGFSVTLIVESFSRSGDAILKVSSPQTTPSFLQEVRKAPFAVSVCPQYLPQDNNATVEFTIVIDSKITSNYSLHVDSTPNDLSSLLATSGESTSFVSDTSPANGSQKIYYFDLPAKESKSFFSFQVTSADNATTAAAPLKDLYISRDRCPSPSCPGKSASKPNGRCDWDAHVKVGSNDRLVKVNSLRSVPGRYYVLALFKESTAGGAINLRLTNATGSVFSLSSLLFSVLISFASLVVL